MKSTTRLMIVISCIFTLAIVSACGTFEATDDSQHVTKLASKIADFDPPTGFTAEFTAEMAGYTLASYKGAAGPSHLYIIQSENEADGDELNEMLTQLAPGSSDWETRMTVIENRPVTIRGQEATLVISEGINHEGEPYRQATVAFQGKGGPAMLVFSDTVDNWDLDEIDTFLASIQ